MNKQKKISLIVLAVMLVCVSIAGVFSPLLNKQAYAVMFNFGVVSRKDNLLVHYIDVGQGDDIAINLPDNKVMLIDTGTTSSANCIKYLREKVFNSTNKNTIDYLVITHADSDHAGGALSVVSNFDVGFVCLPVVDDNGKNYTEFKEYLVEHKIEHEQGYNKIKLTGAGYEVKVFEPLSTKNKNDSCPVIKIIYNNYSFLFTGDISFDVEDDFVETYGNELDSDILKVAHHGSATSSSSLFLEVVTPNFAVISCGLNNKYNHPTQDALDRLNAVDAKIYRTDIVGNVLFVTGKSYGLKEIDGDYTVTAMEFKFIYFVLIVDGIILVCMLLVLVTPKNVNKKGQSKGKNKNSSARKIR